jgi:hypothetical protein
MTIDTEIIRSAAATLDAVTSKLPVDHPLRMEAAEGAKGAVSDLYRVADGIDAQASEIAEAKSQIEFLDRQNNALRQSLGSMIHAYVRLLECGRDRILDLGGQCDPLDVLEASDPWLRDARATLNQQEQS